MIDSTDAVFIHMSVKLFTLRSCLLMLQQRSMLHVLIAPAFPSGAWGIACSPSKAMFQDVRMSYSRRMRATLSAGV